MKKNLLVTGSPGCGKTTVLMRLADRLRDRGYVVGGIVCPEIRKGGSRVGFEIVDLLGRRGILSHISLYSPRVPRVSRYGVNLKDLDDITREAFDRSADVFLVDEIGPMELKSDAFVLEVERILSTPIPLVGAVHYRTGAGFIGKVKARKDTEMMVVTPQNRDDLPDVLYARLSRLVEEGA